MYIKISKIVDNQWFNLIWFKLFWLLAVLGQDKANAILLLLLAVHILLITRKRHELAQIMVLASLGLMVDSLLAHYQVLIFNQALPFIQLPIWLCLVWCAFATTCHRLLSNLKIHWSFIAVLGAILGSFSYQLGIHWQAAETSLSIYTFILILMFVWTFLLPLLLFLSRKIKRYTAIYHEV